MPPREKTPREKRDMVTTQMILGHINHEIGHEVSKAYKLKPRLETLLRNVTTAYRRTPNDPAIQQKYHQTRNDLTRLDLFIADPMHIPAKRWWDQRGGRLYSGYFTPYETEGLMFF